MEPLFAFSSLVAGALLAVQAGANTQLSRAVGHPFGATTVQLAVGAAALAVLAAAGGSLAALRGLAGAPWWHALGGIASTLYVVSTIVLFPRLGAVVSVGLFIAGQMFASVALDSFGWLGVTTQPASAGTVAGTAAVLLGAVAIVLGQRGAAAGGARARWIALALLAGAALPLQGAVNGLLRRDLGAPLAAAVVSFLVATATTAAMLVAAMAVGRAPAPRLGGLRGMPWWGWLGGFVGATYVTTVLAAIPIIGAAAAVGLTIAGQQIVSLFVDRHGWFRLPRRPVTRLRLAGVAALLAGVVLLELA